MDKYMKIARERLGVTSRFICLDDDMMNKIYELDEWCDDGFISAAEIDADRGMSAHCSGFNYWEIERVDTSEYRGVQKAIRAILGGNIEVKRIEKFYDPFANDEELPF